MLIRQLLLIAAGASYGLLSAAGVFTVLDPQIRRENAHGPLCIAV